MGPRSRRGPLALGTLMLGPPLGIGLRARAILGLAGANLRDALGEGISSFSAPFRV